MKSRTKVGSTILVLGFLFIVGFGAATAVGVEQGITLEPGKFNSESILARGDP